MPVVPTLTPGGVQEHVAQTPLATPDSFGAAQAQQLGQASSSVQQAGEGMMAEATQRQDFVNQIAVRQASADYQEGAYGYLQSDILSKQGRDAVGQLPAVQQQLQTMREQTMQGLTPAQQRMFSMTSPMIDRRIIDMQQRHEAQQTKVWNNQTIDASIQAHINDAVSDPENAQATAQAIQYMNADVAAKYNGDPAAAQQVASQKINQLFTGIVTRIASYNPPKAAVYLEASKGQILPEDYAKLSESVNNQVKTLAASHVASTLDPLSPQSQQVINQIQDPEVKALAQAQFNTHATAAQSQSALDAANRDANFAQTVVSSPEQAAQNLPANMPPAQSTALLNAANDRILAKQNGKPIQTDLNVYSNLMGQAANDPDGFLRRPLTPYLSQLSDDSWRSLQQVRGDIANNRDNGAAKSIDRLNTVFSQTVKGVPALTLDDDNGKALHPGPDMEQRVQQINQFRNDFLSRVQQKYPDPNNRTPENAQAILNDMLVAKVVNRGWISNTSLPQGMVDENPSLDRTTWKGPAVQSLTPYTTPAGADGYLDPSTNTVYDRTGNVLGNLRRKSQ